jgi:hypothetical protein
MLAASFAVPTIKNDSGAILRFFEIAFVLVRFDHVARFIVNPDDSIMRRSSLRVVLHFFCFCRD